MATFSRKPRYLHIDLETYSSVDLAECGVYRYAESEDFEILLFGYAVERHIKYTKKIKLNAKRNIVKFNSIQFI